MTRLLLLLALSTACTLEAADDPPPLPREEVVSKPVEGTWRDPNVDTCAELNALCRERWGTDPTKAIGAVWCFSAEGTEQVFDDGAGWCLVPSERVRFQ